MNSGMTAVSVGASATGSVIGAIVAGTVTGALVVVGSGASVVVSWASVVATVVVAVVAGLDEESSPPGGGADQEGRGERDDGEAGAGADGHARSFGVCCGAGIVAPEAAPTS